jgi:hypothetical protein
MNEIEEIKDETELKFGDKAVTEDWELYVRSEVQGLLNAFLPNSVSGDIGIAYKPLIEGTTEGGDPIFDDTQVVGVNIVLSFNFGGATDKPTK